MVFEADDQIGVMQRFLLEDYVDVLSDSFLHILELFLFLLLFNRYIVGKEFGLRFGDEELEFIYGILSNVT